MPNFFGNEYRTHSRRKSFHDYFSENFYFITICVQNHEEKFGRIESGKMYLNSIGHIVQNNILGIENHFSYVSIDDFIVMPNHLHLLINHKGYQKNTTPKKQFSSKHNLNIDNSYNIYKDPAYLSFISPKSGSLGNVIKLFKSYTTKEINKISSDKFYWQKNYDERIITDQSGYFKVKNYIKNNPKNWKKSKK